MNETRLAEKEHWENIHRKNGSFINILSNLKILEGYYHFALFRTIKKYWSGGFEKFIEIGCAPGNYLVKFKKAFALEVFGVEYEQRGYLKTVQNLSSYGIPERNIILADFFDVNFLKENREKYDIVFSAGFIEHFDEPREVIKKQSSLLKRGGLLVCIIPNARYAVEFLSDKKTIALHNQSIMDVKNFESLFDGKELEIKYCRYFGGLFNFGVFGQKKNAASIIFKALFAIQRLTLDNLEKLYFILTGRDPVSKYTSPSLLCIAKKRQHSNF